jgi:hypothetical protein
MLPPSPLAGEDRILSSKASVGRLRAERASFQHPFSSSRYKKLLALDVDTSGGAAPRLKADYLIPSGWEDAHS